eukprot:CAMPEP_0175043932 /NCGR_PEP_ID=MMETSP0052_2-20121109/3494_1 /TAXON_ID=51329 ORGANISM="Polytomella parva, Strain SAG 63-3" /NCGR_SAMPLE_ID=MMETSP0052_2 /ASSEMBLY_ACC=CAM_ASM_000194 /LENGTH=563 /DNA_ID=CAMNT_0016307111 /DNA_START=142 /DNA_END=1829 /DNA_ORIENTATION=-
MAGQRRKDAAAAKEELLTAVALQDHLARRLRMPGTSNAVGPSVFPDNRPTLPPSSRLRHPLSPSPNRSSPSSFGTLAYSTHAASNHHTTTNNSPRVPYSAPPYSSSSTAVRSSSPSPRYAAPLPQGILASSSSSPIPSSPPLSSPLLPLESPTAFQAHLLSQTILGGGHYSSNYPTLNNTPTKSHPHSPAPPHPSTASSSTPATSSPLHSYIYPSNPLSPIPSVSSNSTAASLPAPVPYSSPSVPAHAPSIFSRPQKLTLAQYLGLFPLPPPALSDSEWQAVQARSRARDDSSSCCPICREEFKGESQVLLSCSHTFHKQCLRAYERHASILACCPLCRATQYQRRVIDDGKRAYETKCAIRIQAWFRGCMARREFRRRRRMVPPKDERLRRQWAVDRIQEESSSLLKEMADEVGDLDALFEELDAAVAVNRKVCDALEKPLEQARRKRDLGSPKSDRMGMTNNVIHGVSQHQGTSTHDSLLSGFGLRSTSGGAGGGGWDGGGDRDGGGGGDEGRGGGRFSPPSPRLLSHYHSASYDSVFLDVSLIAPGAYTTPLTPPMLPRS